MALPRRSLEGRSGCGLCGVENIADVVRVTQPVPDPPRAGRRRHPQSRRGAAEAPGDEPLQSHCSRRGLVTLAGDIVLVREDVGRYNALDKLIGAMAEAGTNLATGFVIMTSRCSFELVQKSATYGIGARATVSGPHRSRPRARPQGTPLHRIPRRRQRRRLQ